MTYTIPSIPPSLNKFAGRRNDKEYQELKRQWLQLVTACCRPRPKKPLEKAIVTLTYHFKDNIRRDPDNYSGKMILDGLTAAGIIVDDSFNNIELRIKRGDTDKQNPRTVVKVEVVS